MFGEEDAEGSVSKAKRTPQKRIMRPPPWECTGSSSKSMSRSPTRKSRDTMTTRRRSDSGGPGTDTPTDDWPTTPRSWFGGQMMRETSQQLLKEERKRRRHVERELLEARAANDVMEARLKMKMAQCVPLLLMTGNCLLTSNAL
eukprot:gene29129-36218_t